MSRIEDIRELIRETFADYHSKVKEIPVDQCLGRVCAENVQSRVDIPSRTIAAMDGYAVRSVELDSASPSNPVAFTVKGVLRPDSHVYSRRIVGREAFQVATGAPIPLGADVVVRVEETKIDGDRITASRKIEKSKNVSWKGEDLRSGETIFHRGRILNSTDVALLIGIGRKKIRVFKQPVAGILSIGDELVEFDVSARKLGKNMIVNNYANLVSGFAEQSGARVRRFGVAKDKPAQIKSSMKRALESSDMVFTIAGSSVGARDYTPDAVTSLPNSKRIFHGVRVVPIRPAGLVLASGKPVVIIPGHAVSATLTFFEIGLHILNILSGLEPDARRPQVAARASEEFSNERAMDALILVEARRDEKGEYHATPLGWGSNLLSTLSRAHGYVWLKPSQKVGESERVLVRLFGSFELSRISSQ